LPRHVPVPPRETVALKPVEFRPNAKFKEVLTRLENNPHALDGYIFASDYEEQRALDLYLKKIGETQSDSIIPQLIPYAPVYFEILLEFIKKDEIKKILKNSYRPPALLSMSLHLYLTGQTPETRVGGKHFLLAIQFLQFLRSLPEFQVFHDYTVYVQDSDPSVTRKLHAKIEQALGGGKTHIKAKKEGKETTPITRQW